PFSPGRVLRAQRGTRIQAERGYVEKTDPAHTPDLSSRGAPQSAGRVTDEDETSQLQVARQPRCETLGGETIALVTDQHGSRRFLVRVHGRPLSLHSAVRTRA